MPGIDLRQVRREITIQQVLDLLGFVPTARRGPRLRGPCPIHGDCTSAKQGLLRPSRLPSLPLLPLPLCRNATRPVGRRPQSEHLRSRRGSLSPSRHPDPVLAFDPHRPPSRQVTGSLLAAILAQCPAAADIMIHSGDHTTRLRNGWRSSSCALQGLGPWNRPPRPSSLRRRRSAPGSSGSRRRALKPWSRSASR